MSVNPYPYLVGGGRCLYCLASVPLGDTHNCGAIYPSTWTITTPNTTPPEPQTTEPETMTFTDEYLDALLDALADRTRRRALAAAVEHQKAQTKTWKAQAEENLTRKTRDAADRLADQYRVS